MNLSKPGVGTSPEVTHIDGLGIWLLVDGAEYFLSHDDFPWFKNGRIADIVNVQLLDPGHLYWPALDVDLCVESIQHPEAFPLVYH